jgi:hypothetical protein
MTTTEFAINELPLTDSQGDTRDAIKARAHVVITARDGATITLDLDHPFTYQSDSDERFRATGMSDAVEEIGDCLKDLGKHAEWQEQEA